MTTLLAALNPIVTALLVVLFVVVSVMMMLIVLIQRPQGGGLSGAFGSDSGQGAGQTAFGAKTGDALTSATIVIFLLFLLTAVGLNYAVRPPTLADAPGTEVAPAGPPAPGGTSGTAAPAGAQPQTPPASEPAAPAEAQPDESAPPVATDAAGQPIQMQPLWFNPTLPPGSPGGPPVGWKIGDPVPPKPGEALPPPETGDPPGEQP